MPEANARGHQVPAEGEEPSRDAVVAPFLSINDFIPVADTTARDAAETAFPPTNTRPLLVWRADAPEGRQLELAKDGTTWHPILYGAANHALKTANETVNNSATLQADDHLFVSVEANMVYSFDLFLRLSSGTAPDFKFNMIGPSGSTVRGISTTIGATSTTADVRDIDGADVTHPSQGGTDSLTARGYIRVAGTAGTLRLWWAQVTATASDTIVLADSHLIVTRLS